MSQHRVSPCHNSTDSFLLVEIALTHFEGTPQFTRFTFKNTPRSKSLHASAFHDTGQKNGRQDTCIGDKGTTASESFLCS